MGSFFVLSICLIEIDMEIEITFKIIVILKCILKHINLFLNISIFGLIFKKLNNDY